MSHRKVVGYISMVGMVAALAAACSGDDDDLPVESSAGLAGAAGQGGGGSPAGQGGGGGSPAGQGGSAGQGGAGGGAGQGGGADDTELTAADLDCILGWPKVRRFRITNKLGDVDASLAVANQPGSGDYPPGTVIQLVPHEVMVKRRAGFSAASNDWEFLFLEVAAEGATIKARGTTDVINGFGGNCLSCHNAAERKYDFVCEDGHGCEPLPVTPEQIEEIQQSDPRCTTARAR
jgi:hypothetical protein